MDDTESSISYCPDFSDICSEESTFWDFLKCNEVEKEMHLNQENAEDNYCSIKTVCSSDVLNKEMDNASKSKEYLGIKLSDQESNLELKNNKVNESNSEKSRKSKYDTLSVACEDNNNVRNISNEDEDEFWDFLKSDNLSVQGSVTSNQRLQSLTKLEEIKCLSSLGFPAGGQGTSCTSEIHKHIKWNSASFREDSSLCDKNSTPAEILRDLYQITPEGDSAYKLVKQQEETISSVEDNSKKIFSDIGTCGSDTPKSLPDSISSSDESKKRCESNTRNQFYSLKNLNKNQSSYSFYHEKLPFQKADTQACNNRNSFIEHSSKLVKKYHTNSNVGNCMLDEGNSQVSKSLALEENEVVCINSTISNESHTMKILPKSRSENNMQLPVISSFYSISSCSGLFNQEDFVDQKNTVQTEDFSENDFKKHLFADQNGTTTEEIKSHNTNFLSEKFSNDSNTSAKTTSPKHAKNIKRYIQENSPKNSIFKITDCQMTINNISTSSQNSASSISPKRQKTNCAVNISSYESKGTFKEGKDQAMISSVPLKYIVLPTSTLETNSTTASNPAPFYLILPKSSQTNNPNTELVMVINNSNQITNNVDMKTSKGLNNSGVTVPAVTCSSRIVNNQILHSNYQSTSQNIQQLSLPIISVMNLQSNPNVSNSSYNYLQSNLISNPALQPTVNGIVKLQIPIDSVNKINAHPSTLTQNSSKRENVNFCSVSTGLSSNVDTTRLSQSTTLPTVSVFPNNDLQLRNINPKINHSSSNKIPLLLPDKTVQLNQFIQTSSSGSVSLQRRQVRQQKFKPIKSISLGKDKNAFQQISNPVNVDSLRDNNMLSHVYNTLDTTDALFDASSVNLFSELIPNTSVKVQSSQEKLRLVEQQQNVHGYNKDDFSFAPPKRNCEGILVKRNLITNETEVVKKNQLLCNRPLNNSLLRVSNPVNLLKNSEIKNSQDNTIQASSTSSSQHDIQVSQSSSVDISNSKNFVDKSKETSILTGVLATKSDTVVTSDSQGHSVKTPKSTLTTLQELFPPPISMIPVCVMQTVQTINKPTVSKVLVLQSSGTIDNETSKLKTQRKTGAKKTAKIKKPERKTVKQLLEERYKHVTESQMNQGGGTTKVLRPVYRLTSDGTWVPAAVPTSDNRSFGVSTNDLYYTETGKITNLVTKSNKRPNIMMLPSATKMVQSSIMKDDTTKKDFQVDETSGTSETAYKMFESSPDFLFEKITSKDCKSRYYEMSELHIGYFKVEDNIDSYGRFRSKFKVLFTKRQFIYEFPAVKCNQVDLNCYSGDQIVRIQVPFQTLVAMNVINRQVIIQINKFPLIDLRKCNEKFGLVPIEKDYSEDNCLWVDAVQNSLLHKVLLRKRQADNLITHLCQFDPNFLYLFGIKKCSNPTPMGTPIGDEIASINFRKAYPKSKRSIRRLPQWDSEADFEHLEFVKGDHLLSPNQVCSCRISCKSLRCSCVKAAKTCSTGGTVCLCLNCDNPLNVLESFGINLDFSLSDCCLFQNIYRIPKLRNFLQKCIKLSCCNTVARVFDCIPGTILCPNTECNESLEFSWCQVIICYPERNPRNHCSFCGHCCFSNKRHCSICSRCYIVTPKSPDCPNCQGSGNEGEPIYMQTSDDVDLPFLPFEETKTCSKPEIIILDSLINPKLGTKSVGEDFIGSIKTEDSHGHRSNCEQEESKTLVTGEEMKCTELLDLVLTEVKGETFDISQKSNTVDNGDKPDFKECKVEVDDILLRSTVKKED